MTDKHTRGPWTLKQSAKWPFSLWTEAADGTVIACDDLASYSTGDTLEAANAREGNAERIANAKLRAAAPSLLEALEAFIIDLDKAGTMIQVSDVCDEHIEALRAAISSARGEA